VFKSHVPQKYNRFVCRNYCETDLGRGSDLVFSCSSFILIPEAIRGLVIFHRWTICYTTVEQDTIAPDIMRWMHAPVTFRVSKSLGSCRSAVVRCASLKTFNCKHHGPRRLGHSVWPTPPYKYCSVSACLVTVVAALLVTAGVKKAGKRGRTPHTIPFVFCPLQKRP